MFGFFRSLWNLPRDLAHGKKVSLALPLVVLKELEDDDDVDRIYAELIREKMRDETSINFGLPSVYLMLSTVEQRGWVVHQLEEDPVKGRPSKRYYSLTVEGRIWAMKFIAARNQNK